MNNSKILLYVVFHKHWDFIEECINSIKENLKTIDFDVVIVNSSDSKSDIKRLKEIISEFKIRSIPKTLPLVIHQVYEEFLDE